MAEESLLGSIELTTTKSVAWVRVTAQEGWAAVLVRVLMSPCSEHECRMVKLLAIQDGRLREVLRFPVPP